MGKGRAEADDKGAKGLRLAQAEGIDQYLAGEEEEEHQGEDQKEHQEEE